MGAFLIGFTVLVVFLLFYMSKRLICSSPNFSNSSEDSSVEPVLTSNPYCDNENGSNSAEVMCICDSSNNNVHSSPARTAVNMHSQVENRLRSQIFHMILAENEYQRLQLEASRLARLLSLDQGMNPEDYIRNIRNELSPLTTIGSFRLHRHNYGGIPYYRHELTNNSLINAQSQFENMNHLEQEQSTRHEVNYEEISERSASRSDNTTIENNLKRGSNEKLTSIDTSEGSSSPHVDTSDDKLAD